MLCMFQGEFFSTDHPVEAPYIPPPLPAVSENTSMLYMWLTDYMANTAGFVYLTAGKLNYVVTPDMVPPSLPIQLNTSYFKDIIPQVCIIKSIIICSSKSTLGLFLFSHALW